MDLIQIVRKLAHKIGFDVVRFPTAGLKRQMMLIKHHKIDNVFDIGANMGQYAKQLRQLRYYGKITSFEPLSSAFEVLKVAVKNNSNWEAVNIALGSFDGDGEINIAKDLYCSSILGLDQDNKLLVNYTGKEKITIRKLDSIIDDYYCDGDSLFVKIDAQGYEKNILDGAENSLTHINGLQLEMSLTRFYEKEMLFEDMLSLLKEKGFKIFSMENVHFDGKSGQLYQIDGIFFK